MPGNVVGGVVAHRREWRRGQYPSVTPRVEHTRPSIRGSAQLAGVPLPLWGGSRTTLPSVRNRSPKADTTPPVYSPMYSGCTHNALTAHVPAERRRVTVRFTGTCAVSPHTRMPLCARCGPRGDDWRIGTDAAPVEQCKLMRSAHMDTFFELPGGPVGRRGLRLGGTRTAPVVPERWSKTGDQIPMAA